MSLVISMEDSGGQDVNIEVHPHEVFETFVLRASEILGYEVALSSITGEKEVSPSDNIYDFLMGMAVPEDEDEENMMVEDASQSALSNPAEIEDGELLTNPDGSLVQLALDDDREMIVERIEDDDSMLDAVENQESMFDVIAEQESMLNCEGDSQGTILSFETEKHSSVDNEVLEIFGKFKAEERRLRSYGGKKSNAKGQIILNSAAKQQENIEKDVSSILDKVSRESRAIDMVNDKRVVEKTVIEVKREDLSDDDYRSADEKPYESMSSDTDEIEFLEEHLEEEEEEGEFLDEDFADDDDVDDVDDLIERQLLQSGSKPKIIATIREEKVNPAKPRILGVIRDGTEKRGSHVLGQQTITTYGTVPGVLERTKNDTCDQDKGNDEIIMTVIEEIDDTTAEGETDQNDCIVERDLPLVENDDDEFTDIEFLDEEILEDEEEIIRTKISTAKPTSSMDLEDDITSYTIVKHEVLDDEEIAENKRKVDKLKKKSDEKISADVALLKKGEKTTLKKEDKKNPKKRERERKQDTAIKVEQVYTREELLDLLEGDSDKSDSEVETKIKSIKDSGQFKLTKTLKRKANTISPPIPVKNILKKNNKVDKSFASSNLSNAETQKILNIIKSVRQPEVKVMKLSDKEIDNLTTKEKFNLKRASEKENHRNSNGIEEAANKSQVQEASDELYADLSKIFGLEKDPNRLSKSTRNLLKYSRIKTEEGEEEDVDGDLSGEDTVAMEDTDDYIPGEDLEWGRKKSRGSPTFVCRLCGQNLFRATDAITHALFHKIPDRAIFPCIVCQYGFTSFPEVRKHIRSAHVDRRSPRRSLEKSQSAKLARSRPGPLMIKTEPQMEEQWLDEAEVIVLEEWLDEEEEEMIRQAMEIRKPDKPVHVKQEKHAAESEEEHKEEEDADSAEGVEADRDAEMDGMDELQELLQLGGRTKKREWLQCQYCKRKYDTPQYLARHKCTGAASGDCQRCALCGQAFHTNRRLMFHRTFHQAELLAMGLACDRCGEKDFQNEVSLYDHINLSHNATFFCPEPGCGKDFRLRSSLKSHGRIHGKKRQHRCDVCGKQFFDTQNLKEHKISHLKVKPFQCHICLKFVNRRSRLRMHLLAHEARPEMNAVLACRCCKMAFRTTSDAENHVKESSICRENIEGNQVSGLELLAEAEKLQMDEERRDQVEIDLEKLLGEAVHGDVMNLQEENQDCRTIEEVLKDHQDLEVENSGLQEDLNGFEQEIVEDYQKSKEITKMDAFSESIIEDGIDTDVDLSQDVDKVLDEIMEGATNKMEREEVECTKAESLVGGDGGNTAMEIRIAEPELAMDQSKLAMEGSELSLQEANLNLVEVSQSVEQQLQEAGILLDGGEEDTGVQEIDDGVQRELKEKDGQQEEIENSQIQQLDVADNVKQEICTDSDKIQGTEEELLEQLEANQNVRDIQETNLAQQTDLVKNEIQVTDGAELGEPVEPLKVEQGESILELPGEDMGQADTNELVYQNETDTVELGESAGIPDMIEINQLAPDQQVDGQGEEKPNIEDNHGSVNLFDIEDADDPGEVLERQVEEVSAAKKTSGELEAELTPLGRLCIEAVNIKMVYRCEFCERVFCQKEALNEHRIIHQNVKLPYVCNVCNEAYSTYARVTSHKTTHGFYQANIENGSHEGSASKMSGYEEFPVVKHFLCQVCNKTFLHWTYLQVHRKHKHTERAELFSCKLCGEQFLESWMLNHHKRKVHVEAMSLQRKSATNTFYKCADCGDNFSMRKELAKHRDTEHNDSSLLMLKNKPGPFSCTECDKVYQTKVGLEGHMRIHNGGVYLCDLCGNGFAHRAGLETHHKRVHLREQPHSCEECGQSFFSSAELFGHRRCHTGEKPFPCNFCSMYFRTKGRRNEHHRVHTGERPYPCDLCGLAFRRSHAMKNHRLIHTGERQHSCPHCSKMFHVKSNLNSHIKQKHSGQFLVLEVEGGTEVRTALEESLQILSSSEIIQQHLKPDTVYSEEEEEEEEDEEEGAGWAVEGERIDSEVEGERGDTIMEGDTGEMERADEEMQVVVEDDGVHYQVERVGGEGGQVQYAVKYVEEEVAFAYQ